jgi:hypothetical protein
MSSLQSCNYRSPPSIPLCKAVQLTVDDQEMKLIKARILPPPVINNNNAEINMGRINLRGKFIDPHPLKAVAFVYFGPTSRPLPQDKKSLMEKFVASFDKVMLIFLSIRNSSIWFIVLGSKNIPCWTNTKNIQRRRSNIRE